MANLRSGWVIQPEPQTLNRNPEPFSRVQDCTSMPHKGGKCTMCSPDKLYYMEAHLSVASLYLRSFVGRYNITWIGW